MHYEASWKHFGFNNGTWNSETLNNELKVISHALFTLKWKLFQNEVFIFIMVFSVQYYIYSGPLIYSFLSSVFVNCSFCFHSFFAIYSSWSANLFLLFTACISLSVGLCTFTLKLLHLTSFKTTRNVVNHNAPVQLMLAFFLLILAFLCLWKSSDIQVLWHLHRTKSKYLTQPKV